MSDSSNVFNHRVAEADRHCQVESFEEAIRALDLAEASKSSIPTDEKVLLAKKRGNIERCKGNNDGSIALLLTAISLNGNFTNLTHVELIGELGAVYLNKDEYENAQEQFIEQHRLAQTLIQGADDRSTKIAAQVQACRAIGNLGLAKIQCAMAMPAEARTVMYKHAIRYLEMRVTIARNILQDIDVKGDPGDYRPMVAEWQSLGLDRLAFCHTAIGDHHRAISCGEAAIELANKAHDPSMLAFSRFYYGNALQAAGSIEEAIHQWNPEGDLCTPAIAFCKQPSEESCRNLRKLRSLAVGFDGCDEFGYSALDYAVLAGLDKYAALVMRGLRDELDMRYPDDEAEVEHQVDLRKAEARRRKHYRETFQTTFRPRLSQEQEKTSAEKCIAELRELYAHDLRWDLRKQEVLDTFNFLSYTSFKALGHLPNPGDTDGMERLRKQTRDDSLKRSQDSKNTPYVIFFSYEWRGKSPAEPDDESKTQYSRMKDAIEQLLKNPGELTGIPDLTEDRISIWLVSKFHRVFERDTC